MQWYNKLYKECEAHCQKKHLSLKCLKTLENLTSREALIRHLCERTGRLCGNVQEMGNSYVTHIAWQNTCSGIYQLQCVKYAHH